MTRVVWCTSALVALLSLSSLAGQSRSVADGVYSAGQAARGSQIYRTQCAECHGAGMEGTSGPPLAGDFFLSNWSTRSLSALVDRIQKTMPFSAPGTLTRQQSRIWSRPSCRPESFRQDRPSSTTSPSPRVAFRRRDDRARQQPPPRQGRRLLLKATSPS